MVWLLPLDARKSLADQRQQFAPGGDEFLALGQPTARNIVVDTTAPLDASFGQGIAGRDFIHPGEVCKFANRQRKPGLELELPSRERDGAKTTDEPQCAQARIQRISIFYNQFCPLLREKNFEQHD